MSYYIMGNSIRNVSYTGYGRCATLTAIPIESEGSDILLEGPDCVRYAVLDSVSRVLSIKTIKEIKELRGD